MKDFDNHLGVLALVKALGGLKDAPRASGLKLTDGGEYECTLNLKQTVLRDGSVQ